MAPETTAFNNLATSAQLPKHPPLSMLLRDEDTGGAALRSLPRFGGARGAHRAMPAYKALAREKLRVASAAQQRAMGATRMHNMLRAYASCFSSLLFSAYRTGIVSDALMVAGDNTSIYKLLVNVFSLPAIQGGLNTIKSAIGGFGPSRSVVRGSQVEYASGFGYKRTFFAYEMLFKFEPSQPFDPAHDQVDQKVFLFGDDLKQAFEKRKVFSPTQNNVE